MLRKTGLILAAFVPTFFLRHLFYRLFFRYKILGNSKIGAFNYIDCAELTLNDANIGFLNQLIVEKLELGSGSYINNRNRIKNLNRLTIDTNGLISKGNFIGGAKKGAPSFLFELQNLQLGKRSEVQRHNYFDILRPVIIGDNVVFGGEGSEIWTHGFETDRTMLTGEVTFGNNIFIGSKCIFTKNIVITNDVTIAPGSVVYKSITEKGIYSTHQLIKIK